MRALRALGLLALAGALAATSAAKPVVFGVVAATFGLITIWRRPDIALETGVVLALTVRPWVDVFSERSAGLGPFVPNPAVLLGLLVLGIAGVHAVRRIRIRAPLWPDQRLWHAHLFLMAAYGIAMVSGARLYGSAGFSQGIREIVRVGSIIAAFLLVLWWVNESPVRFRRGWLYLLVGLIGTIGVALWQLATDTGFLETIGLNRLQGTLSHPNSFGQYLVPFVLFALGAAVSASGVKRLLLLLGAATLTWLILLTYSRTVFFVLATGLVALPVLHARQFGVRGLARTLAVLLLVVAAGWLLAGSVVRERFANLSLGRNALDAALSGASENSYEWRLINWGVLIDLGLEHPVTGHGAGMTTVLNPIVDVDNGVPYNAHNDFVRFFFEAGLLGLASYMVYAVLLCLWAIRRARVAGPDNTPGAFAVAAAWLAMLLLSAGNTELSLHTSNLYTLYGMLALVTGGTPLAVPTSPTSHQVVERTNAIDRRWT